MSCSDSRLRTTRAVNSSASAVRAAHVRRPERYIRANLTDPDLSPERIAAACAISKRYVRDLFRDMNATVAQRIRDERLIAARDCRPARLPTITVTRSAPAPRHACRPTSPRWC